MPPFPKLLVCKNGHPRTPENVDKNRRCILCARAYDLVRSKTESRLAGKRRAARKWMIENPERHKANHRANVHTRRARKLGESWTAQEWTSLKLVYDNKCISCMQDELTLATIGRTLSPDHIRPLSKDGRNVISNIQPLCHGTGGCNNRKGSRWVDYRAGFPIYLV